MLNKQHKGFVKVQEENLENTRVLIVSDSPDRVNYLKHHIEFHHMKPIRYPNHGSAMHALKVDSFHMVVVDLTLPIDSKIEVLKAACNLQKSAKIIAIGKTRYIEKAGVLDDFPTVELIPDIQGFPQNLAPQESSESD
jgi:ActR/RegA family two-component response regulator